MCVGHTKHMGGWHATRVLKTRGLADGIGHNPVYVTIQADFLKKPLLVNGESYFTTASRMHITSSTSVC